MRVGLPHMGNIYIPLKALFQRLNVDYVIPPAYNQQTMSLGVRYSPEGLCIPFKLTLGNLIEAAELGADTLLMAGGYGVCRLGYYAKVQEQILHDLGYNVEVVNLGVSERKLFGLLELIKRLANNAPWSKIIPAFRFGLAMDLTRFVMPESNHSLTLAVDAIHPRDYSERMHLGLEYGFKNLVFLRGGYKTNYDEEDFSFGAGFHYALGGIALTLDYSYLQFQHFDAVNMFSFDFEF